MKPAKLFMYGLFAVILALSLTGCDNGSTTSGSGTPATITYTAEQTGGVNNTTTSDGIVFTFSASVDSLNLTVTDIIVSGEASKGSATLSGSGTSWTLSTITVNNAGLATVSINKPGIETATKNVIVHRQGQATPTEFWSIKWNFNGGTPGAGAQYPTQIAKNAVLAQPSPDPTKSGNTFGGWYSNSGLTAAYTFASPVTENLSLYAKWETGNPLPPMPPVLQPGAIVNAITISGVTASVGVGNYSLAAVLGNYQYGGIIELPLNPKTGLTASVLRPSTSNFSTIEYAIVADGGWATTFAAATTGLTFEDGYILIIKSISADGFNTLYYRVDIVMGRNANLASVTIGTNAQTTETYLGVPATAWDEFPPKAYAAGWIGQFQTDRVAGANLTVKAVTQDSGATIKYAFVDETIAPTTAPTFAALPAAGYDLPKTDITDNYYLYLEVTPGNVAAAKKYYKMLVILDTGD